MNSKPKIIILGHKGFIGKALGCFLKSKSLDVLERDLPDIDLTDQYSTRQLLPYLGSDVCLIFAAAVKRQFGDNLDIFQKNMAMVVNVCSLLENTPVRQVIYFSSASVYGEETQNLHITEDTPVNPTSYYGISKYTAERILEKTCLSNDIKSLICLRPPLIYGPGDAGRTYGPSDFCQSAVVAEPITLWGDGTELREFVFIEDICRLIGFMMHWEGHGVFNVVSGNPYSFFDIITILRERFPELVVQSRERSRPKADNAFSPDRLKAALREDFQFTSLEQGIDLILQHLLFTT